MRHDVPIAAIAPLLLIGVTFVGYCLWDLARQPGTRGMPKAAWAVLTVISVPLGGILYLLLGRSASAGGEGRDA